MWNNLPEKFDLSQNEIHVFCWKISSVQEKDSSFYAYLSEDEITRAQRFKFDIHRQRFVINRMFLRSILSHYLEINPQDLRFTYNAYGKPALENSNIFFNLSHSEDFGILAIAREKTLGIDIEYVKPRDDLLDLARRFFSPQEVQQLEEMAPEEKLSAFYQLWTLKEAFIKAVGQGLSLPLDSFAIDLKKQKLIFLDSDEISPQWTFIQIPEIQHSMASLAMMGHLTQCQFFWVEEIFLAKYV